MDKDKYFWGTKKALNGRKNENKKLGFYQNLKINFLLGPDFNWLWKFVRSSYWIHDSHNEVIIQLNWVYWTIFEVLIEKTSLE